jgi:hypothetical protein
MERKGLAQLDVVFPSKENWEGAGSLIGKQKPEEGRPGAAEQKGRESLRWLTRKRTEVTAETPVTPLNQAMVETEKDRSYGSYQKLLSIKTTSYQKLLSIKTMKGMRCKIKGLARPSARLPRHATPRPTPTRTGLGRAATAARACGTLVTPHQPLKLIGQQSGI